MRTAAPITQEGLLRVDTVASDDAQRRQRWLRNGLVALAALFVAGVLLAA